jgi:hypothetical protein
MDFAPKHGTHEQWESGCDCEDCYFAMRAWIGNSDIPRMPSYTLESILEFRKSGNEFYLTPRVVSTQCHMCRNTARRHIDVLVRIGVLSKIESNSPGRAGTYRLHFDKIHPRPEWIEYRQSKKRRREELIAGGYCPVCSKCMGEVAGGLEGCGLYACQKCGTLLLEMSCLSSNPEIFGRYNGPTFVDVTGHWQEIRDWYNTRLNEIRTEASRLEIELLAELPGVIEATKGSDSAKKTLVLVKS